MIRTCAACRAWALDGYLMIMLGSRSCLSASDLRTLISYQPASRFWEFQAIEASIFVILALVLVAVACRMVLARNA